MLRSRHSRRVVISAEFTVDDTMANGILKPLRRPNMWCLAATRSAEAHPRFSVFSSRTAASDYFGGPFSEPHTCKCEAVS